MIISEVRQEMAKLYFDESGFHPNMVRWVLAYMGGQHGE